MNQIDCVYVISLQPKTEEYKKQVLGRIEELGIPGRYTYYIYPAINGTDIPKELDYRAHPTWRIDGNNEDLPEEIKPYWCRDISPGEIGCSLSHIMCWKDAQDSGHKRIVVLEEDFNCVEKPNWEEINSLDCDLFFLGRSIPGFYGPDRPHEINDNIVYPGFSLNSHAYILNKKAIDYVLSTDFLHNITAPDDFLTASSYPHPRDDMRELFPQKLKALAYARQNYPVDQEGSMGTSWPENTDTLTQLAQSGPENKLVGPKPPDFVDFQEATPIDNKIVEENTPVWNPNQFTDVNAYIIGLREFEFAAGYTPKHPNLFEFYKMNIEERNNFEKEWLHPDFIYATRDPSGCGREWGFIIEEPIPNVFSFPFFKEEFCNIWIEEAENFNHFLDEVSGSNADDAYPTTDIRLAAIPGVETNQVGPLEEMYRFWVQTYILNIIHRFWRYSCKGIQPSFMARYQPGNQAGLELHHDNATCALLVRLNSDYTGGGTWFESQKTLVDPPVGYGTLHPSRLTHRHGGRAVLSGNRYLMITFID